MPARTWNFREAGGPCSGVTHKSATLPLMERMLDGDSTCATQSKPTSPKVFVAVSNLSTRLRRQQYYVEVSFVPTSCDQHAILVLYILFFLNPQPTIRTAGHWHNALRALIM